MQFAFGILRLLLAVAVLGGAFALTRSHGLAGLLVALVMGVPVALLVLIGRRSHVKPVIRTVVSCGMGMFVGLLLSPAVGSSAKVLEMQFTMMTVGAIVGWVIGLVVAQRGHLK